MVKKRLARQAQVQQKDLGVQEDHMVNVSQQCCAVIKKQN
jgi:hypothetical protein